ncbi:hypothetical protein PWT90_06303 [Aphanocladium album]|nr:hypothetical protein PWT90_06303 [Aphanocladium album]
MSTQETPTATYYQVQPPQLPVDEADAALVSANPNLPYDRALAEFPIPPTLVQYYPDYGECDFASVTHLVLKVYYIEQAKILARAGIRYNWDFPFLFWHFLGRIVSHVFLGAEDQLSLIHASVAGDREFVSFATRGYVDSSSHRTRVIEVHLGWEDEHDPLVDQLRAFWKPARRNIIANINWISAIQSALSASCALLEDIAPPRDSPATNSRPRTIPTPRTEPDQKASAKFTHPYLRTWASAPPLPAMQGFNMGKYVPPEHEGTTSGNRLHKKHALGARASKLRSEGALTVRFEMPYAIWCGSCPQPTIIGQGVRFNAEKRRVGRYHTTPIWGFRFRHAACGGAIEMRTDPQNTAYVVVSGATRRDTGNDDDKTLLEREGGVPILTDAEREELRSNAFASLEKTINDREQLRASSQRIDGLADVAARQWADPYTLNQKLRKSFRVGRKEREASAAATEALQDRMSLGMEIVPETEEDARRARLVDFAPDEELVAEEAALAKPLFVTAAPKGESGKTGLTKEAKGRIQTRESFASQVMGNTRAAKDPFLLSNAGVKRGGDGKIAARFPAIKRKRDGTSSEDARPANKAQQSSSSTSKATALVEYDSD